ncbi:MAG: SPFH domain-containing protein [Ignisphaera sp.]|uniref:Slipin family protein n=1 Tax=Ignisphaera aggregans TaxID=334771 RepID=A0A7C4NMA9_9CREN
MDPLTIIIILLVIIILSSILARYIRVIREWERIIILRLGKYQGIKGPGLIVLVPFIDKGIIVDLRLLTIDVPKQEVITKDNVTVTVDAVVYYRIVDPEKAVLKVKDPHYSIALLTQTSIRDVIGQVDLDMLLTQRETVAKMIQSIVDNITEAWGLKVSLLTLKSVELPPDLIRAIAKQAEAERLRRARIIEAEAEREAAKIIAEAAIVYENHPSALRLRELQTYTDIAKEKNLIVITETSLKEIASAATISSALSVKHHKKAGEGAIQ